jgi:hypothetical protein
MANRSYTRSIKLIAGLASVISIAALTALAFNRHVSVVPQVLAQNLAQADSDAPCPRGNATLRGTYMSIGGGTAVGTGPVTFVGEITYDGKGNSVNPFTASFNGSIFKGHLTATYMVNSDCSGSLAALDGSSHYDFVVSPDGSKVNFIETDQGFVVSGTIARFKTDEP